MSLGPLIRTARRLQGLTGPELAVMVGVSRGTIYNWENERTMPTIDRLATIASALDVPYGRLHIALVRDMLASIPGARINEVSGIGPYAFQQAVVDLAGAIWPDLEAEARLEDGRAPEGRGRLW